MAQQGQAIQVDSDRVTIALRRYRMSLEQNADLMTEIGMSQLASVRRTFRSQGSPDGSWMPLAPSTIKRNPKLYGPGHKLLILSGRLLNSIRMYQTQPGEVILGTNLPYAAVHQYGSRDRGFGISPRTAAQEAATVNVRESSYYRVAPKLGTGRMIGGKRKIQGPRNARQVLVGSHTRHQNIPARPYLVFRPEDPERIRQLVVAYNNRCAQAAGLEAEA